MRGRRIIAIAVCAPVLSLLGAGVASAGEVTGPPRDGFATGDFNPIINYKMHSICAFSGLNAYHEGKDPVFPTVQSYGMAVRAGAKAYAPSPGDACNGHTGELTQN
jgi:hypothetical protein